MIRRMLRLMAFVLTISLAGPALAAGCREDTLPGRWRADWTEAVWEFRADGALLCEGRCNYGTDIGTPETWAYEPSANLWSRPLEFIKLIFSAKRFEGTTGAFRCDTEQAGQVLQLEPFRGKTLTFRRSFWPRCRALVRRPSSCGAGPGP